MTTSRYVRQVSVPGVGDRGQEAIRRLEAVVEGRGLAAEVCALYLAGAGVKLLVVDPSLVDRCRALNHEVEVVSRSGETHGVDEESAAISLSLTGLEHSSETVKRMFSVTTDDAVLVGSRAARWAIARALEERRVTS